MALQNTDNSSSFSQVLVAAEKLTNSELRKLVSELLALRAQREAPILPTEEAELIQAINRGLPEELLKRYHDLIEKRLDETLTDAEHEEFMRLNKQVEALNVERVSNLVSLAKLRQLTLPDLMQQLGIPEPVYVS